MESKFLMSKEQNLTKGLLMPWSLSCGKESTSFFNSLRLSVITLPVLFAHHTGDTLSLECLKWEPSSDPLHCLFPTGQTLSQITLCLPTIFPWGLCTNIPLLFSLPELRMKIAKLPTLSYVCFCLTYIYNCSIFNMLLMSIYIKINHSVLKF